MRGQSRSSRPTDLSSYWSYFHPGGRRNTLLVHLPTSTGLGAVAGAGAGRACGRSPVRGAGDGVVGHALARLEIQSAEGKRAQ
eukprot:1795700-Pleurochrysis_carterae.AAC.1